MSLKIINVLGTQLNLANSKHQKNVHIKPIWIQGVNMAFSTVGNIHNGVVDVVMKLNQMMI